MENYNELEQMRQEIASLRERLERQTIISEELIRKSMKDKVYKIKVKATVLSILGVAGIVYCFWVMKDFMGLSLAFAIVTDLFLAAAVVFSLWSTRKIHPRDMMGEDLASAGKEIARMKKLGIRWKKAAYPFLAVWFIWLVIETLNSGNDNEMVLSFLIGCGLGVAGGIICGSIYDKKQSALIDGLLTQIDELTK